MENNIKADIKRPLISVIISTFNRSYFLKKAVHSVLSQTYKNIEVIIVNDASTDDTPEVVKQFTDHRMIYVQHSANRGGPAARNSGIRIAQGDYIALLDDDDIWLPQKLQKQIEWFEQASKDVGVIYSGSEIRRISDNKLISVQHPKIKGNVKEYLLVGSLFGSVSKALIKKECFYKAGLFDEALKSCQDWDMWFRIADHYKFDFVPEILSVGYLHQGQLSSNFASIIPGRIGMINKHIDEFKKHPSISINHYKQIAKLNCLNGSWNEALIWFKKAVAINPFETIKIALWLVIEFPFRKIFTRSGYCKRH